ncbi:MAG: hypothetical protein N2235_24590, partial [Fischerella sp.]|nr:hypothetical protein [Fischerella sp.]
MSVTNHSIKTSKTDKSERDTFVSVTRNRATPQKHSSGSSTALPSESVETCQLLDILASPSRQQSEIDTESACFVADEVVENTVKRTWVHRPPAENSNTFLQKKVGADSSVAKTRKLLDGAIALAWYTVKSDRRPPPPALTRTRWVWRLAGSYHLCHSTPRLMEQAAQRFAASGRKSLAQWAALKAREEAGYDRLALLDIQSMGYDAEAVVKVLVPPAAKTLVDYFTQSVQATDPIGCVGSSYT